MISKNNMFVAELFKNFDKLTNGLDYVYRKILFSALKVQN